MIYAVFIIVIYSIKDQFTFTDLQRGYTTEEGVDDRGGMPVKRHSMDMAMKGLSVPEGGDPSKLRSTSTEDIGKKGESGAESDTAGMEPDRPKRRGRSPFRFFKKKDEKGAGPQEGYVDAQGRTKPDSPPGTSLTVRDPSVRASATQLVAPAVPDRPSGLSPTTGTGSPRRLSRVPTEVMPPEDGSDYIDSSSLDLVDEYFYGIRIFPGQEPNHVYCGWVTTTYKQFDTSFDISRTRKVVFEGFEELSMQQM